MPRATGRRNSGSRLRPTDRRSRDVTADHRRTGPIEARAVREGLKLEDDAELRTLVGNVALALDLSKRALSEIRDGQLDTDALDRRRTIVGSTSRRGRPPVPPIVVSTIAALVEHAGPKRAAYALLAFNNGLSSVAAHPAFPVLGLTDLRDSYDNTKPDSLAQVRRLEQRISKIARGARR